jgi:hypothetical protein
VVDAIQRYQAALVAAQGAASDIGATVTLREVRAAVWIAFATVDRLEGHAVAAATRSFLAQEPLVGGGARKALRALADGELPTTAQLVEGWSASALLGAPDGRYSAADIEGLRVWLDAAANRTPGVRPTVPPAVLRSIPERMRSAVLPYAGSAANDSDAPTTPGPSHPQPPVRAAETPAAPEGERARRLPGGEYDVYSVDGRPHGALSVEHVWPRSRGGPAGDLQNRFTASAAANNARKSLPFGEVAHVERIVGGLKLGLDASGRRVAEPPDHSKGNLARAVLHVAGAHNLALDPAECSVLRRWSARDPVDDAERARNAEAVRRGATDNLLVSGAVPKATRPGRGE